MMKILWLSPTLNHYKVRLLNKLQTDHPIEITVLAGTGRSGMGDGDATRESLFSLKQLQVPKKRFGISAEVRRELNAQFDNFDWVMLPKEDKNILLFIYAVYLRKRAIRNGRKVRLFSYNHPVVFDGPKRASFLKRLISHFYYATYDRVIFYTQKSCESMVNSKFIEADKAFWANNTVDTDQIDRNYTFCYPDPLAPTLLFIGRLIRSKMLDKAVAYYSHLKNELPDIKLIVIGDGPDASIVRDLANKDPNVTWTGALVEEKEISEYMTKAWLVLVPGASGLSINHAFAYGRPYATLKDARHGPEITYLVNDINGFILDGSQEETLSVLAAFLTDMKPRYFDAARRSGRQLSIANWSRQFMSALEE
jgi:glycosyltransferase involved in cell wall biosynthesis